MKKFILLVLFCLYINSIFAQEFSISKLKKEQNNNKIYLDNHSSSKNIKRHDKYTKKRDISISFNFGSHQQNYNLYGLTIKDGKINFPGNVIKHMIYGQSLYALVRLDISTNEYVFYIIDLYGKYYTRTFHLDWSETISSHSIGHPRTFVILNQRYLLLNCLRDSFSSSGTNVFIDCWNMSIIYVEKFEL